MPLLPDGVSGHRVAHIACFTTGTGLFTPSPQVEPIFVSSPGERSAAHRLDGTLEAVF